VDVVDPSPLMKQLMREADHLPVLSADLQISTVVTVLPLYVVMVYTGTTLPFSIVFEE